MNVEFQKANRRSDQDDGDSTDYPSDDEMEQDGPLDLTVDVLDLRKRQQSTLVGAAAAAAAVAAAAASTLTSSEEKTVPLVPTAPCFPSAAARYFGAAAGGYPGASLAGLPFFYPGLGGSSYSAYLESKLAEMGNPAMDLSALALAAAHHDAIRQAQAQTKMLQQQPDSLLLPSIKSEQLASNNSSKKSAAAIGTTVSPASVAVPPPPTTNDALKMVLNNGVLL